MRLRIWLDKWEMGLDQSDRLAIVLSPDAIASRWVRLELNAALVRERQGESERILPILYRDRVHADFTGSYKAGLDTLEGVLRGESETENARPARPAALVGSASGAMVQRDFLPRKPGSLRGRTTKPGALRRPKPRRVRSHRTCRKAEQPARPAVPAR